jgi:hypothetical protein
MEDYRKTEQARIDCYIEIHLCGWLWKNKAVTGRLLDRDTSRWRDMERQGRHGKTAR